MMAASVAQVRVRPAGLAPYAVFAAMLSAAGLPIYIHAPKVYAETFGIGLGSLGAILFALRLIDLVQDPLLGWLASRLGARRGAAALAGVAVLAASMLLLFAVVPPIPPIWWFAIAMTLLFSAYSFLGILFYAQGVARAATIAGDGHLRLAGWRETGALVGVCLAAIAPTFLSGGGLTPLAPFAAGFAILCLLAWAVMRGEWAEVPFAASTSGFRVVLADRQSRRILVLALVNAAPLAVTSTLFLFFVESRLALPGWEGPLLIVFFLSAAVAAPVWSRAASRFGSKAVLLSAMVAAIVTFAFAATLGPGDLTGFLAVCVLSGAMTGADLVIMPAVFARRLAVVSPEAAQGFGLWAFVTKLSLSVAAAVLLPLLDRAGFVIGAENSPAALEMLTVLYALVPCALKLVAAFLLMAMPLDRD